MARRGTEPSAFLLAAVAYKFGSGDDAAGLAALASRMADGDAEPLREDAAYHELEPLLHLVAEDCSRLGHSLPLPAPVLEGWSRAHGRGLAQGAIIAYGAARALSALGEAGIRVIPLKGFFLASCCYQRQGARGFRDLDLLVEPRSLDSLHRALLDAGFFPRTERPSFVPAPAYTVYALPVPESDLVTEIDIHVGMHWPEEYSRRTRFRAEDLWSRASPRLVESMHVWALCPEHLLITTLLDAAVNHRYARLIKFRDALEILRSMEMDWDELERYCRLWEVRSHVGPGLLYLSRLDPALPGLGPLPGKLLPGYTAMRAFLRSLPPESLPGHRSRSYSLPNLLFFLLADSPRERARGLAHVPAHLARGRHRF